MEVTEVEMNNLRVEAPLNARAPIDQGIPAQPRTSQEFNGPAPQEFDSPDIPGTTTDPSFPRIFKRANPEDVLRDIADSCTPEEKAEAWSKTAEIIKTYSDDMFGKWNSEIDTLLVYAGLFSAILTAFNVESYKLLQPSAPDPTGAILERMSAQLRSFSVTTPFINSTEPHYTLSTSASESPAPTRAHVWLNILWFSGLICSLASASIGIMVKQWLRELSTRPSGTQEEVAQIRQYRLNNLVKWRVAGIVSTLPMLLQLSLILFLSGLLVLLWTLHPAVAAVSSALVGLLLTFIATTIVLPAFRADCCYISPPTHAILPFATGVRRRFFIVAHPAMDSVQNLCRKWFGRTYASLDRWRRYSWEMLEQAESSTWSLREAQCVDRQSRDLTVAQVVLAYSLNMQAGYLSGWGRICLIDGSRDDPGFVINFIDGIRAVDTKRHEVLGFPNTGAAEELEVWLYVLLRLWVSDGGRYAGDRTCLLPPPAAEHFKSGMTHARSYISNSMFWSRADCCRPDVLLRTLKILAPIAPMILQDDMYRMKTLVVLLSRHPKSLNTWMRAQYVAQVTEELLQCPDRSIDGLLEDKDSSVDLAGVLVACADVEDTPKAVAAQLRSLALHEVTHLVHLLHVLHRTPGRKRLQALNPWDMKCLAERLQQMYSLERRCRRIEGEHAAAWLIASEVQPLPPPFTEHRFQWSAEHRKAARDELLVRCEQCIPSFRHPDSCPICRTEKTPHPAQEMC